MPRLAVAAGPVLAAAALASFATLPNIPGWYAGLAKPPGTPPGWAFGPAWTMLYALMIWAAWRILTLPPDRPGRRAALAAFAAQLALNALWSWSFFAARNPALGAVNIALLLLSIGGTVRAFARLDRGAAWLLAPYLAWVAYAAYLNGGILVLNG